MSLAATACCAATSVTASSDAPRDDNSGSEKTPADGHPSNATIVRAFLRSVQRLQQPGRPDRISRFNEKLRFIGGMSSRTSSNSTTPLADQAAVHVFDASCEMTPLEDLAEIARQPFISEMLGASEERFTEIQQAVNAFKTLEHKTYSALKHGAATSSGCCSGRSELAVEGA